MSSFRDKISLFILKGLMEFFPLVPEVLWKSILLVFPLFIFLFPKRVAIGMRNLKRGFPEKGLLWRFKILLKNIYFFGYMLYFICLAYKYGEKFVRERCLVENSALLNFPSKTGFLILTGHTGNWEIAGFCHSLLRGGLSVVARPVRNKKIDNFLKEVRRKMGMETLPFRGSYFLQEKIVKEGRDIAYLPDHNAPEKMSFFVPFFGEEASHIKTPFYLAKRTKCPVLIAFSWFERKKIHIRYERLIQGPHNPEEFFLEYGKILEQYIRKNPEQYLWIHDRWKTKNVEGN